MAGENFQHHFWQKRIYWQGELFLDAKERLSMEHLFSAHPQQGAAQQETGVCPREGQIRECCRQWFLTEGDVDDFIFYGSQPRASGKGEREGALSPFLCREIWKRKSPPKGKIL